MPTTARLKPHPNPDEDLSPTLVWGGGFVLVLVAAGLFWGVWKTQFAAPAGFLFDTPGPGVEAGYCLSVAQTAMPGGDLAGSYFDEASQFWIKRMREIGADMGPSIAAGRAALSRDKAAAGPQGKAWVLAAMERCSLKAITYGAHFKNFD